MFRWPTYTPVVATPWGMICGQRRLVFVFVAKEHHLMRLAGRRQAAAAGEQAAQMRLFRVEAQEKLPPKAVQTFEPRPEFGARLEAVVREDVVVLGPHFPAGVDVGVPAGVGLGRYQASLVEAFALLVVVDVALGQPPEFVGPHAVGFALRDFKRRSPHALIETVAEHPPRFGVIGVLPRGGVEQLQHKREPAFVQAALRQGKQNVGLFASQFREPRLPIVRVGLPGR